MGKEGWDLYPPPICTLFRIIQEKVPPIVGTECMGAKSLFLSGLSFLICKIGSGKTRTAELLASTENVRFRRMRRWGDLTKGGPRGWGYCPSWLGSHSPFHLPPTQCLSSGTEEATWPQARGTGGHPQSPPHGTGWGTCCCPRGWQCPRPRGLEPGMSPVSLAQGRVAPQLWPLQPHCL